MNEIYGKKMEEFYSFNNHRRGGTPGGGFTGKVLRKIISEESLVSLSDYLGEDAMEWIDYLDVVRDLYHTCVKEELDEDYMYEKTVEDFKSKFNVLNAHHDLSETLKVHIFSEHIQEFFAREGVTLKKTSDEPIETCIGKFGTFSKTHGYKCNVPNGPGKRKKVLQEVVHWNSKNKKFKKK